MDHDFGLKNLLSSLHPTGLIPANDEVLIDMNTTTCTCTDFVWRSALRDMCIHIKAVLLFIDDQKRNSNVRESAKGELAEFLRRKQLARPRQGRDELLCDADDSVRTTILKSLSRC